MGKFKHFLWFQFPAIAWLTAIFIQSSMSHLAAPDLGFDMQDKFFHVIEYAILGYLLRRALLFQNNNFIRNNAGWLTIVFGALYAISDEIHQSFVPGRFAGADDVIADVIGVSLVVLIYFLIGHIKQRRKIESVA